MSLYIDDAFADEDITVRISNAGVRGDQTIWKGIQTQPISFAAQADFQAQTSGILKEYDDLLTKGKVALSVSASDGLNQAGRDLSQVSLKVHKMTIKTWSGTEDPIINVSFAMVNSDATIKNVFEQYYDLYAAMFPVLSDTNESGTPGGESLLAPYGFVTGSGTSRSRNGARGLWNLDIGRWFSARNLILTNVSLDSSLTLDATPGDTNPPMPMYAAVTCTFTTERAAIQSTVKSWLKRNI